MKRTRRKTKIWQMNELDKKILIIIVIKSIVEKRWKKDSGAIIFSYYHIFFQNWF